MRIHKSVTLKKITASAKASMSGKSYTGFCVYCGRKAHGVEGDACKYECEKCGKPGVYGGEELLMMVA